MSPATLIGAGAIALWAFLAVLTRLAVGIPPFELTALAFTVSAVLGFAVLAARGRLGALRRGLTQGPLVWLHGVGGLFGYHAFYFAALAFAPAAPANLLNYLWPLLTVLLAGLLLGLRLTWRHGLGTALAVAGCLLLLGGGASGSGPGPGALIGYAFAIGAAVTWAFYSVLARRLAGVPTETVAAFCAATAMLAALAHALFEPTVVPDGQALLAALLLGVGPIGAAFYLWDIGMKRGDPRLLGTLAYATPVLSTLLLGVSGFAVLDRTTLSAALLVALGGLVAARA